MMNRNNVKYIIVKSNKDNNNNISYLYQSRTGQYVFLNDRLLFKAVSFPTEEAAYVWLNHNLDKFKDSIQSNENVYVLPKEVKIDGIRISWN